jgi:hypothetical protein
MSAYELDLARAAEKIRSKRETKDKIIRKMRNGTSLYASVSSIGGVDMADIFDWKEEDSEFAEKLASAQCCFADLAVDLMHDAAFSIAQKAISDGGIDPSVVRAVDAHARAVKWIAERTYREKYQTMLDKKEQDLSQLYDFETVSTWV